MHTNIAAVIKRPSAISASLALWQKLYDMAAVRTELY